MASRVVAAGGNAPLAKAIVRHCVPRAMPGAAMTPFAFMNGSGAGSDSKA